VLKSHHIILCSVNSPCIFISSSFLKYYSLLLSFLQLITSVHFQLRLGTLRLVQLDSSALISMPPLPKRVSPSIGHSTPVCWVEWMAE
uniref:Uncharacterized protein n=2 Tax=Sus scrofa TaxID=9823 RepID=A0A8D1WPW5_PIG